MFAGGAGESVDATLEGSGRRAKCAMGSRRPVRPRVRAGGERRARRDRQLRGDVDEQDPRDFFISRLLGASYPATERARARHSPVARRTWHRRRRVTRPRSLRRATHRDRRSRSTLTEWRCASLDARRPSPPQPPAPRASPSDARRWRRPPRSSPVADASAPPRAPPGPTPRAARTPFAWSPHRPTTLAAPCAPAPWLTSPTPPRRCEPAGTRSRTSRPGGRSTGRTTRPSAPRNRSTRPSPSSTPSTCSRTPGAPPSDAPARAPIVLPVPPPDPTTLTLNRPVPSSSSLPPRSQRRGSPRGPPRGIHRHRHHRSV